MGIRILHGEFELGEVDSVEDLRAVRESIRGREFKYGIVSNALDFVLTDDDQCLIYLSPRDRKRAEEMAEEIQRHLAI